MMGSIRSLRIGIIGTVGWILLSLPGAAFVAAAPPDLTSQRLFTIRRSINSNEVIYEVRLLPEGFLEKDPIQVYWIMNTKGGSSEPLTPLEEREAYGVSILKSTGDQVVFAIRSLPDRPIHVRRMREGGRETAKAFITLRGQEYVIDSIFISIKEGGLIPKVKAVDVKGRSVLTGEPVVERITDKSGKKD